MTLIERCPKCDSIKIEYCTSEDGKQWKAICQNCNEEIANGDLPDTSLFSVGVLSTI